jgi:hypothetical protein
VKDYTYNHNKKGDGGRCIMAKTQEPAQKITKGKRTGGMAQVVEYVCNKHKVFKPQYCTPHQKKSKDKFVHTQMFFSILTTAYG